MKVNIRKVQQLTQFRISESSLVGEKCIARHLEQHIVLLECGGGEEPIVIVAGLFYLELVGGNLIFETPFLEFTPMLLAIREGDSNLCIVLRSILNQLISTNTNINTNLFQSPTIEAQPPRLVRAHAADPSTGSWHNARHLQINQSIHPSTIYRKNLRS